MIFGQRDDTTYFLTMNYQEPNATNESHDPYVVLNRWRTLLITLDKHAFCEICEPKTTKRYVDSEQLKTELEELYQGINQLFGHINSFAEKAVAHFNHHGQLCEHCRNRFHIGASAAQAMQDSIYENPDTPDTIWFSQGHCIEELCSAISRQNEESQEEKTDS